MKANWLNLASEPFVNLRPVRRVGLLLWLAGGALAALNGWLYWSYYSGSGEMRDRLTTTQNEVAAEEAAVVELDRQIEVLDLEWMNEQVEFLNLEISARTFPWSELFDRLVEALPDDVRLIRLNPQLGAQRQRGRGARRAVAQPEEVRMQLDGEARDDEQLLAFVDALFAHPSFRNPSLATESRRDAGTVGFMLTVAYLPGVTGVAPQVAVEESADEAAVAEPAAEPAQPTAEAAVEGEPASADETPTEGNLG